MGQQPRIVKSYELHNHYTPNGVSKSSFLHAEYRVWLPCRGWRPSYLFSPTMLWKRIVLAWGVFTGKYDAFDWEEF